MIKLTSLLTLAIATGAAFAAEKKNAASDVQRMPTVTATDSSLLNEERPVGETGRPEWTSARRFPTTRVYIQKDPWEVGVEQWWRYRYKRDGSSISRLTSEIEIGLPHRMQLDLYYDMAVDGDSRSHTEDFAAELRYAFADWGKIPLNPTVYAEYKWTDKAPDVLELKLLLGDQIAGDWHYGVNFVWERQLGGELETEWMVVAGISKTLLDGKLSVGIEAKYDHDSVHADRENPEHIMLVGPSVQWRITENIHLSTTALFGTNQDSPRNECYFILGYDFGKADGKYHPVSGRR